MAEVKDFKAYADKLNKIIESDEELPEESFDESPVRETSYKEKIRSHKLRVFFRTVIIAAVTIFFVAAVYISWRDKEYSEAVISTGSSITNGADAKVISLSGHIVQYSKDGISCLDESGQVLWNQTYEMQSPIAHTCQSIVAVGDYNGHNIYVNSVSGSLGQVDTNLPIRDFCVSSQGVVAAVLDGKDVTWIYLYDSQGNTLANFKTTMKDSGYPIDISISPNAELVCVSYLYPEDGQVKTSVAFFNFGSVGQNAIDNYASGFDYPGEVVPYVQFMNSSASFAISDARIMFYSGDEKPIIKSESFTGNEEIRSVYFSDSYVGLVFANSTDEGAYRLQVYNESGAIILTTYFDMDYTEIIFDKNQFVIYNEDECVIKDMKGHDKFKGTFDKPVRTMVATGARNKFILVTASSVDTYVLK